MRKRINLNQNQLALPFGERSGGAIAYDHRARLFFLLVIICLLSLFTYIYAINATARNVAVRQNLEKQITDLSTNLDSLEFTYIALKNNVTLELAYQLGFREVKSPLYVSRAHPEALTLNTIQQ